jgi:PKD repeat protein
LIVSNLAGSDTLTFPDYITVYAPISISISQNGNDLTCNPAAASYQWWMNGNAIPGATSQTLFINQTGLYVVTVSDSNGCTAADTINVTSVPSPAFSASQVFLCEKFCIDFTDTSTNNPSAWQWLFPGATPPSSQLQNPSNICYDTPGNYDVTLITSNTFGNDTLTLTDYITVYPTPPFPVITQNGDTLTCTPASSYQWQFNSVDVAGATNQSFVAMQTGNYTVIITDVNSCVNATTKYVDVTGLSDPSFNTSITIFPNPNNGTITIEYFNASATDMYVSVTNALGQMIYSSEEKTVTQGWKKELSLGEVSNGIYYLQISGENGTAGFFTHKILVAR